MNQTWENSKKPIWNLETIQARFWLKFRLPILYLFSKIWLRQSLDVMVSYHHKQYQEKLLIQSWENLVTDGQIDGQTDESDFIGRCWLTPSSQVRDNINEGLNVLLEFALWKKTLCLLTPSKQWTTLIIFIKIYCKF